MGCTRGSPGSVLPDRRGPGLSGDEAPDGVAAPAPGDGLDVASCLVRGADACGGAPEARLVRRSVGPASAGEVVRASAECCASALVTRGAIKPLASAPAASKRRHSNGARERSGRQSGFRFMRFQYLGCATVPKNLQSVSHSSGRPGRGDSLIPTAGRVAAGRSASRAWASCRRA